MSEYVKADVTKEEAELLPRFDFYETRTIKEVMKEGKWDVLLGEAGMDNCSYWERVDIARIPPPEAVERAAGETVYKNKKEAWKSYQVMVGLYTGDGIIIEKGTGDQTNAIEKEKKYNEEIRHWIERYKSLVVKLKERRYAGNADKYVPGGTPEENLSLVSMHLVRTKKELTALEQSGKTKQIQSEFGF